MNDLKIDSGEITDYSLGFDVMSAIAPEGCLSSSDAVIMFSNG